MPGRFFLRSCPNRECISLLWRIRLGCRCMRNVLQPLQLRAVLRQIGPLLSVDFVRFMPWDVTARILSYLGARELCQASMTCRLWRCANHANHAHAVHSPQLHVRGRRGPHAVQAEDQRRGRV